jgi:hypothetical protein
MINKFNEYLEACKKLSDGSNYVYIVTYGMNRKESITAFLNSIKGKKVEIIISTSFKECTPGCKHCSLKNNRAMEYFNKFKVEYPMFKIWFTQECHAKCFITSKGAIVGGINFSESGWNDYAILIKNNSKEYAEISKYYSLLHLELDLKERFVHKDTKGVFSFGKYCGSHIDVIRKNDPQYIEWCYKEIPNFEERINLK